MAFKVKKKPKRQKGAMGVVDDIYDAGENVVQKANPFFILGNSMGFSDQRQERIHKLQKQKEKNEDRKNKKK